MILDEYKDILEKVDEILPPRECIAFNFSDDFTTVFDNKLGGIPYYPKDKEYPINMKTGEPLALLVQINFDTFKSIPNYPETGILQIYISTEDYGMNFNDQTDNTGFRIIYHKDIIEDTSKLLNEIPYNTEDLPYQKEYKLIPTEPYKMYASMKEADFEPTFVEEYNKLRNANAEYIDDIDEELERALYERNESQYLWLGGYPTFTQDDPRTTPKYSKYDLVLFASDTYSDDYDFMWGDAGTAQFFITEEALKNLDFSDILYNWDCC